MSSFFSFEIELEGAFATTFTIANKIFFEHNINAGISGGGGGPVVLSFTRREAASMEEAISSATKEIEAAGFKVKSAKPTS